VSRSAGATLTFLVGATMVRLGLTGEHRMFIRGTMGPWLILGGIAIAALSVVQFLGSRTTKDVDDPEHDHHSVEGHHDHHADDGHDHVGHAHSKHEGRLAWLLVIPSVLLLLVAPGALGSFALSRTTTLTVGSSTTNWPQLKPSSTTTEMHTADFVERAFDVGGASMRNVAVRLTGFVSNVTSDGFDLVRYQIACCAADAVAARLHVEGSSVGLRTDMWVTVTGVHRPGTMDPAVLESNSVTVVPAPKDPYE
jgi:uncharacterized repeat protein (TIGR03943 family)